MRTRKRRRLRPEAARALVVLIVLGVCIYIALATTAGNYIAAHIIAPLFQRFTSKDAGELSAATDPAGTPSLFGASLPTDGGESVAVDAPVGDSLALLPGMTSAKKKDDGASATAGAQDGENSEVITLDAFTSYALQMGAFSSQENADAEAQKLRSRGAAGFVYHNEHYRVLASIYKNDEDAQAVRKQLQDSEGIDSSVFKIEAPGASFRVYAGPDSLVSVKNAFEALQSARDKLYDLCSGLDRGKITQQEARAEMKKLADDARKPTGALDGTGDIGIALQEELKRSADELEKVATMESSAVAFSTEMKYALVRQTCAYADMMIEITGSGKNSA